MAMSRYDEDLYDNPFYTALEKNYHLLLDQALSRIALETKYTVLRQKLLVDCLGIRMETDQLEAMSQNDKQQKVMILDNQAVEQIQIGKIMPSLLGEGFHLQVTVTQMMGLCKHVFQNTVKGQQVIGSAKTKENLDQL
ncbi:hypothetical protein DPMN_171867 [Dreissena polymorpha]|uniref:Uncharacterized protein n=1 Tax=Dreissena polymorpha TaxID=45954 RepID=A0A9D4E0I2_DREPO|nr:hypothetical protein DPMN_171867 [Dreissena polymorpha]